LSEENYLKTTFIRNHPQPLLQNKEGSCIVGKAYKSFPSKPDRNKKPANPIFFGCGLVGYRSTEVPFGTGRTFKNNSVLDLQKIYF